MTRNKVKFWVNGVEVSPAGGISKNYYPSDGSLSIGYSTHSSTGAPYFGGNSPTGTIHEVSVYDCKPPPEPFTDRAALKTAVDSYNFTDATYCSTDPACTDRSSTTYRCGAAACTDMPDWDVSLVTDMSELFKAKAQFNVNISAWDTSQVTDMQYMLHTATNFNKDIGDWNVGRVTNMQGMFAGARNFNGDLSRWDVGSVRNMGSMFLTARKFAGGDLSSWNTSKVTTMHGMFACGDPSPSANVFNGDVSTWDVSSVTDMTNMFIRAGAFNQDISSWSTSKVTDMKYMFKGAAAFYQDITGWTTTSLTTSTGMFTGATAWLDRVQRGDGTGTSTDGPISEWVHKPCLVNERVQSGWCVPCGGGGIRPAGDDPSSGDTMCAFPDTAALKAAVDACLSAVPSGEACCSTDANCADPSSARCGSAGCVDMPEWDVSLVTDMEGLFRDCPTGDSCVQFNADISAWDTSQVTDMGYMFIRATLQPETQTMDTSQVRTCRSMFRASPRSTSIGLGYLEVRTCDMFMTSASINRSAHGTRQGHKHGPHVPRRHARSTKTSATWDTSQVTDMTDMFIRAASFNQDISSWSTSKVTDMKHMFKEPPPSTRTSPAGPPPR